jgi:hypothetical protein
MFKGIKMNMSVVTKKMKPEVFAAKMSEWNTVSKTLAAAKETEMILRKELFEHLFTNPDEGVNTADLAGGWKAKGEYKLTRKLDITQLQHMRERLQSIDVSIDTLVRYKPELDITAYRGLTPATLAVFNEMVTTTPGAPTLTLVPPKSAK